MNRSDNFNRTNSTTALGTPSDAGSDWVAITGTWGISSNKAYNVTEDSNAKAVLDAGTPDVSVTVTLTQNGGHNAGVFARLADADNYYRLRYNWDEGRLSLVKFVANTPTLLAQVDVGFSDGDTITLECLGNRLKGYINSDLHILELDESLPTGDLHGLYSRYDPAPRFDDFSITGVEVAPFLAGWSKRKEIRYGATIPASNLSAFPLLLKIIDDADIGAELSSRKFAVTEADGETEVPYGHYNDYSETGGEVTFTLRALFDLDSAALENEIIGYLYYDDSATDQSDRAGLADGAGLVMFLPFEEDPSGSAPQMLDWSSNGHHGTTQGSMTSGDLVAGQVGYALDFDGSDDKVTAGSFGLDGDIHPVAMTVMCWFNWRSGNATLLDINDDYGSELFLSMYSGNLYYTFGDAVDHLIASSLSNNTWHFVALASDGVQSSGNFYDKIDGTTTQSDMGDFDWASYDLPLCVGDFRSGGRPSNAIIGEIRVYDSYKTPDYLNFTYENESDNAATVTLGAEETAGTGEGIIHELGPNGVSGSSRWTLQPA